MIAEKRLLFPVLLALAAVFLLLGVVTLRSGADLDRLALVNQRLLIDTALRNLSASLAKSVKDYSWWNELRENLLGDFSPAWAEHVLIIQGAANFDLDSVWVAAADDRLIFGRELEKEGESWEVLRPRLQPLLEDARAAPMEEPLAVSGLALIGGLPHLVAASAITAEKPAGDQLVRHPRSVLVFTRALGPALLGEIASGYLLDGLRLVADGDGMEGRPLSGADGAPLGRLVWRPERPSAQFYGGLLPAGLVAALLLLGSLAVFYRRLREGVRHLERINARLGQVNRDLEEAIRRAEAANRAKSAFLANMSHELRTPLNAMLGHAQNLQRESGLSDPQRRALETIRRSGDHLLLLINDILDLARIEAGRLELSAAPCDLYALLRGIEGWFRHRAAEQGIGFRYTEHAPLPSRVLADEKRLRQILGNLLDNALKFTGRGGEVCLQAAADGNLAEGATVALRLSVTDTGIGIAPERLGELFRPFQQSGAAEYRNQGTGLGLAISQSLARQMGGGIEVASQPGKGSRFSLRIPLPVLAADALSPAPARAPEPGPQGAGEGGQLDVATRQRLLALARRGDISGIRRLLADLPEARDGLLARLREQAARLDLKALRGLLEGGDAKDLSSPEEEGSGLGRVSGRHA